MKDNINFSTKELLDNIKSLVQKSQLVYNKLLLESVKTPRIKELIKESNELKNSVTNILVSIQKLESVNPNLFICYDNDVYLSVSNKKYIISKVVDSDIAILKTEKTLEKALASFTRYAYGEKKKRFTFL